MSRTYEFLLRWLPDRVAKPVLVIWYTLLVLAVIYCITLPPEGFIYWDN